MQAEALKKLGISSQYTFNWMFRRGWIDSQGRALRWYDHQRPNHNDQFDEPREPRRKKQGFKRSANVNNRGGGGRPSR